MIRAVVFVAMIAAGYLIGVGLGLVWWLAFIFAVLLAFVIIQAAEH